MSLPRTLDEWLAHCERLHPPSPDKTLARVAEVRARLGLGFSVPVITVAGTNGKGSSCAMLESIARCAGYRVGLYTSPHLVHFEERCRIDGRIASAEELLPHFAAVDAARDDIALTYFEFTSLVIMRALAQERLDCVILEVGLGGRLDAVNAIDADCALVTCIDLDHVETLGPDRETIGLEKAQVMRGGRPAVLADPSPPASMVRHGEAIGADLWLCGRDFGYRGEHQQWSWHGRTRRFAALGYPALRGANQLINAAGVLAVFEALSERLPVNAQAVRQGLATVQLPGRFQVVPGRPALVLDVAHNPHAVGVLARNLDDMGFYPCTHAVFGAMRDKDIAGMVEQMDALVDRWYLCDLPLQRAAPATEIERCVRTRRPVAPLATSCHPSPEEALRAALGAADPADRIVVFGSFLCVGGVLQHGMAHWRASSGV